jgi:hypothetical protein
MLQLLGDSRDGSISQADLQQLQEKVEIARQELHALEVAAAQQKRAAAAAAAATAEDRAAAQLAMPQPELRVTRQRMLQQEGQVQVMGQQQSSQQQRNSHQIRDLHDLRDAMRRTHGENSYNFVIFHTWAEVCGTGDVAALLRRFDDLQQHLQSSGLAASTVTSYLRALQLALQLPGVQCLVSEQQLALLQQRVQATKQRYYVTSKSTKQQQQQQAIAEAAIAIHQATAAAAAAAVAEQYADEQQDGQQQAVSGDTDQDKEQEEQQEQDEQHREQQEGQQTQTALPDSPQQQEQQQVTRGEQQQQEEQQQQTASDARIHMTMQQLRQLLQQQLGATNAVNHLNAMTCWSRACSSDDVSAMLRNFEALLQRLKGTAGGVALSPATAAEYLRLVQKVVELSDVQALLSSTELEGLVRSIAAERRRFAAAARQQALAAAAAAACSMQQTAVGTGAAGAAAAAGPSAAAAAAAGSCAAAAAAGAAEGAAAGIKRSPERQQVCTRQTVCLQVGRTRQLSSEQIIPSVRTPCIHPVAHLMLCFSCQGDLFTCIAAGSCDSLLLRPMCCGQPARCGARTRTAGSHNLTCVHR